MGRFQLYNFIRQNLTNRILLSRTIREKPDILDVRIRVVWFLLVNPVELFFVFVPVCDSRGQLQSA